MTYMKTSITALKLKALSPFLWKLNYWSVHVSNIILQVLKAKNLKVHKVHNIKQHHSYICILNS